MTNVKVQRKGVYSREEIDTMLEKADSLKTLYFRLRAKALMGLFKTGKRREEVGSLEMTDLKIEKGYLYVTFTVVKKRKKSVFMTQRTKRFPLESEWAQYIIKYWQHMKEFHSDCQFLFPSVRVVFGQSYAFSKDKHLSGRQILRIIKQLNPKGWCHLFRETRGADVVRADEKRTGEASLLTLYRVQKALDLEKTATAMHYINRFATETIEDEE